MSEVSTTRTSTAPAEESAPVVFTVKEARNNSGHLSNVDSALQTVKSQKVSADRVAGQVMWNAALLTHSVIASGHVGSGKEATMTQRDYVRAIGFSEAYGTALKRLGRAAVVHGVKRGTPLWGFLCSKSGDAVVGKAIALESTEEALRLLKGYAAEYAEHGKITKGASTPRVDDGSKSDKVVTDPEPEEGTVTVTLTPEQEVAAALDMLDRGLRKFDPATTRESWAAIENRLTAMIEREVTLRLQPVEQSA